MHSLFIHLNYLTTCMSTYHWRGSR